MTREWGSFLAGAGAGLIAAGTVFQFVAGNPLFGIIQLCFIARIVYLQATGKLHPKPKRPDSSLSRAVN